MNTILIIDDELYEDPNNLLRASIETFAKDEIGFKAVFVKAPPLSEIEIFLKKHNPKVIFLDIVHIGWPPNIAELIRQIASVPVLILTNFRKDELEDMSKEANAAKETISKYIDKLNKQKDNWHTLLKDSRTREERLELSKLCNFFEEQKFVSEYLKKYNDGKREKGFVIKELEKHQDSYTQIPNLKKIANELIQILKTDKMPDILGEYPVDLRQTIGYVLKSEFEESKNIIKNGILSYFDPPKVTCIIAGERIIIKNAANDEILCNFVPKDKIIKTILESFENKKSLFLADLLGGKIVDKNLEGTDLKRISYRLASRVNRKVYKKSNSKVNKILKRADKGGEYSLDVESFIVNDEVRWDGWYSKEQNGLKVPSQGDSEGIIGEILSEIKKLRERVEVLESKHHQDSN